MAKLLSAPCMFCGGNPCICDGGTKKKSSKPTVKASSATEKKTTRPSPSSTPSDKESDEAIFGETPAPAASRFKPAPSSEIEVDLSALSVLRMLRPLLCARDQRRVDATLSRAYSQELDKRVEGWKASHGS